MAEMMRIITFAGTTYLIPGPVRYSPSKWGAYQEELAEVQENLTGFSKCHYHAHLQVGIEI